jgi:hypothetical protein
MRVSLIKIRTLSSFFNPQSAIRNRQGLTATPHAPSPALIVVTALFVSVSITVTSFERLLAA